MSPTRTRSPANRLLALLCWLLACLSGSMAAGESAPRILLLNSYHPSYGWTEGLVHGVLNGLAKAGMPGQDVAIEYLDAKRYPDLAHAGSFAELLQAKYRVHAFGCIVVSDNAALEFMLDRRDRLLAGVPIVFCGINAFSPEMLRGQRGITGVAEVVDIVGTVRIAMGQHPQARRLVVIHDQTGSGISLRREFDAAWAGMGQPLALEVLTDLTYDELGQRLGSVGGDAIVLLLSYASDSQHRVLEQGEEARFISTRCSAPFYALHQQRLGHGVIGGVVLSGREHGARAGAMAARILAGADPDSIPVDSASTAVPMFDAQRLRDWGIPESRLPLGSRVVNRPHSLWSDYRPAVLIALISLALLLGIIAALISLSVSRARTRRSLEATQRFLLESQRVARIGSYEFDVRSGIWQSSEGLDAIFGIRRSHPRTVDGWTDIVHPEDRAAMRDYLLHEVIGAGNAFDRTYRIRTPAGEVRWVHGLGRLDMDQAGRAVRMIGTIQDVTERRELEDRLRQMAKMDAIGQLAGGVAHDFNNQLAGIMGYAEMMRRDLSGTAREQADRIVTACERAAGLTRQLLAFARKGRFQRIVVDMHQEIAGTAAMLARSIDPRIRIVQELADGKVAVRGDPSQLQNALLNLALNARDAMPAGGQITFRTARTRLRPDEAAGLPAGDYVRIEVVDTGCGMDDAVKAHLFEPFFTTKEPGKGTGMGLAAVYGTVRTHGGSIAVDSAPGAGSCFRILLPAAAEAPAEAGPAAAPPRPVAGLRVMVVDDEPLMRDVLAQMLRAEGCVVVACAQGDEALQHFRQHWRELALVILDMQMPGMNGRDCFRAMRSIHPGVRVLMASGFGEDGEVQGALADGLSGFIRKPFRRDELLRLVAGLATPSIPG